MTADKHIKRQDRRLEGAQAARADERPVHWLDTFESRKGIHPGDVVRGALNFVGYEERPLWLNREFVMGGQPLERDRFRIIREHDGWYGYVHAREAGHWLIYCSVRKWPLDLEPGLEYRLRLGPDSGHAAGRVWAVHTRPAIGCQIDGCPWGALWTANRLADGATATVCDLHRRALGAYPEVHAGPLAEDTGGRTVWEEG